MCDEIGTSVLLRVATSVFHLLMSPFVAGQTEDRVNAVSRSAAGRFRQDHVLTVLGCCVNELLRIHRRRLVRKSSLHRVKKSLREFDHHPRRWSRELLDYVDALEFVDHATEPSDTRVPHCKVHLAQDRALLKWLSFDNVHEIVIHTRFKILMPMNSQDLPRYQDCHSVQSMSNI